MVAKTTKKKVNKKVAPKKVTKKKVAKKKVAKKRPVRKVKESEFDVALGSEDSAEKKVVSGNDVEDVLDDVETDEYDKIIIKKKGYGGKPKTEPDTKVSNKPTGLSESNIKYPYIISLPLVFSHTTKTGLNKKKEGTLTESGGRVNMTFSNEDQLTFTIKRLKESRDPLAKTVLSGIIRSIK